MQFINNGNWHAIWKLRQNEQKWSELNKTMKLLVLSKKVTACYRRGKFNNVDTLLE